MWPPPSSCPKSASFGRLIAPIASIEQIHLYTGARPFRQRLRQTLRDLAFRDDVRFEIDALLRLPDGREFSFVEVLAVREYFCFAGIPFGRLRQRFESLNEVRRLSGLQRALWRCDTAGPGANNARNNSPDWMINAISARIDRTLKLRALRLGTLVRLFAVEHPREAVVDFV